MVVGGSSDVVITVEPVREETRTAEVRAAVVNRGSSFGDWVKEEAAWLVAQFAKVALSVFVVRGVTKLFQTGTASQQAYARAQNLWTQGYQERGYRVGDGASWRSSGSNGGTGTSQGGATGTPGGNGFDQSRGRSTPENPRYVTTVGGYHLYLHQTVLDPARQQWPCPLLYRSPCESCFFLEYDRSGTPHCAALLKLEAVLKGVDGGEDLNEMREWIRNS
jgi:hypothetical protein